MTAPPGLLSLGIAALVCVPPGTVGAASRRMAPALMRSAGCAADAPRANLNFTLKDSSGRAVRLSAFSGKLILLDFWATWCAPCKTEIPWYIEFQDRYGPEGLQVVGVSVDDTREQLAPYLASMHVNYVVLQGRASPRILDAYGPVQAVPTTLLIAPDGRICERFPTTKTRGDVEAAIRSLLPPAAAGPRASGGF